MIARALSFVLLSTGCAVGKQLAAPRSDYALYREYRLASTKVERLERGGRYLHQEPDGRFRAEIERWFVGNEAAFYEQARQRASLLRIYLRVLPHGPHAADARDRLKELELLREYRDRADAKAREAAARALKELEVAQQQRSAFVGSMSELLGLLGGVRTFARPLADLDPRLLAWLKERPPGGTCSDPECHNRWAFDFAVPDQRRLVARKAPAELRVELTRGRVTRVVLSGPELWNRLYEASALVAVQPGALSARVDAIARSVQLVENTVEPLLPAAACSREAIAPVVLARECQGVRLEMTAATVEGGDDRIEIHRAAPRKPAAKP